MQSLSALVRLSCLHLVAATPASPPGSIVILEPGENSFTIQWSPGASNDCNFQAWQVQLRSRNLNGTLVGSWRQATEVPTSRDSPNCTVDGLQRNSPYDLQIFERCANGADDSSAGEPEQVLWTLPGYWEIHIPPHDASSYVVEDTLEAHAGCEVIKSCCDDQFSLCFSGNESRTVEVQRVDTELGWWQQVGWGQDLYLRCHAPSVAAFKNDPISKELPEPPWYLRLYEATHVTAQVVFHHGNFIGGCQCANHQLQTRPDGSTTWRNESGDCLVRDSRHCNIQDLRANARIYGRMQTTCLDESMNSNWSELVEVITRPACTWTYDSSIQGAAANELECVDKTFCDFDADSSCCSSAGGRLRCPQNYPVMCENQDCVGSTDYCCVSTEAECSSKRLANTMSLGDGFGTASHSRAESYRLTAAPSIDELMALQRAGQRMLNSLEDPQCSAAKWSPKSWKTPLEQGEDMLLEQGALDAREQLVRVVKSKSLPPDPFRSHIALNIKQRMAECATNDSKEGLAINQRCLNIRKQLAGMVNARKELASLRAKVHLLMEEPILPRLILDGFTDHLHEMVQESRMDGR